MKMDVIRVFANISALLILGIFTKEMPAMQKNWFDAQTYCANNNKMLPTDFSSLRGPSYWTARYQRESHWIKLIGCFEETDVKQEVAVRVTMEHGSAGYCQEICLKSNKSIFAIKNTTCLCLRNLVTGSGKEPSSCNITCSKNIDSKFTTECGGETAYNVYGSREDFICKLYFNFPFGACVAIQCNGPTSSNYYCSPCNTSNRVFCQPAGTSHSTNHIYRSWKNSMIECKDHHLSYLHGNLPLSSALNACTLIPEPLESPTWIGVAKQVYQGVDQGYTIEPGEQLKFIQCEKCTNNGCLFTNCAETNRVYCTDIHLSTITYPPPSTTMTSALITKTTQLNQSATTATTSKSNSSSPQEVKRPEENTPVLGIVIPIIFILLGTAVSGAVCFWWRRRKQEIKETEWKNQVINLNENEKENKHIDHEGKDVHNSSYFILEAKSSYEQSGNDITQEENPYNEAKEGEYDHLGNTKSRRKVINDDDYFDATKDESRNKATKEGDYDHLGNNNFARKVVDDTYCHTSLKQLDDSSDYDVANHTEKHDLENTYDHASTGVRSPNDSNYDYSELKQIQNKNLTNL